MNKQLYSCSRKRITAPIVSSSVDEKCIGFGDDFKTLRIIPPSSKNLNENPKCASKCDYGCKDGLYLYVDEGGYDRPFPCPQCNYI